MNTIYTDTNYILSVEGDVATLTAGVKSQSFPVRHGTDEIPASILAALKKRAKTPRIISASRALPLFAAPL